MSGKLIVIDGLDGSGKTTHINRLCDGLEERGIHHRKISFPDYSEPSSTLVQMYLAGEFGQNASDVNAYAASVFYAADRYASFKKFWETDYRSGKMIIAARYVTSNAIHQMAKLPREKWGDFLDWLAEFEYDRLGLPRPDHVFFLDMPTDISQKLLTNRYEGDDTKKDVHERDVEYLRTCRETALFAAEVWGWEIVPFSKDGVPGTKDENQAILREAFHRLTGVSFE